MKLRPGQITRAFVTSYPIANGTHVETEAAIYHFALFEHPAHGWEMTIGPCDCPPRAEVDQ